jgi:2-polyprenyl-3-methyl-5-hydroxy-6-metoxy-1,4-benzoquinol methylase
MKETSNETIEDINKAFYDDVYKSKNSVLHYLHQLLSYDQQSKSKVNYRVLIKHFRRIRNLNILDYGSGHGCLLFKFGKSNSLNGCDISTESVKNLIRTGNYIGKKIDAFTPDQAEEHIKDETLDIVTSSHVLEHVPDDIEIIRLLHRKLRKGGTLLLNLPINEVWNDPNHLRSYTEGDILNLLENNGFEIIDRKRAGRINGWMLKTIGEKSFFVKLTVKVIKVFLAVSPYFVYSYFENNVFKHRIHTHFIVLSRKS